MIDPDQFQLWMGMLGDRFNRALTEPTFLQFHSTLSAELTTEQFVAGAKRAFDQCRFWPTPKEIIDFAKPPALAKLTGAEVFESILTFTGSANLMHTAREKLDDVGMRAFLAIGGPARFKRMLTSEEDFVRKEFVAMYDMASHNADELNRATRALGGVGRYPELSGPVSGPRLNKGPERTSALLPGLVESIEELR